MSSGETKMAAVSLSECSITDVHKNGRILVPVTTEFPPSPSERGPRLLCEDVLRAIVMQSTVIMVIIIVICFFGCRMRGSLAFMTEMSRRWSLHSLPERQCMFVREGTWAQKSIIRSDALQGNY